MKSTIVAGRCLAVALAWGMTAQKPFTPGMLADTVRRILDQGRN